MRSMMKLKINDTEEIPSSEWLWIEYLGREYNCFRLKLFTRQGSFERHLNDSNIGKDFTLGSESFNLIMGTDELVVLRHLSSKVF